MDECWCKARPYCSLLPSFPSYSSTVLNTQTLSSSDIYFNILVEYTHILVPTDGTQSIVITRRHALRDVSMEQLMQQTTFVPLFSKINVPKHAFRLVFDEILQCANHMVYEDEEDLNVFNIRVDLDVTTPLEDDSCDEGDYKDEQNNGLIEDEEEIEQEEDSDLVPAITRVTKGESYEGYYTDEEEMEVEEEEEDNGLVPARAIESESHELDHDDNYGYDGNDDLVPPITRATKGESYEGYYTDEEEMEVEEEEDNGLVPARAIEGESYELDYEDNYGYDGNDDLDEDEDEEEMEVEGEEEDNEVVPSITRASEGEGNEVDYEESYGYEGYILGLEEDEEEMIFEEEDNEVVPSITRASEGEGLEVDYEESYGNEGYILGLEEDEEQMIFEEEYNRFIPAAKSCVEELEMIRVEEAEKCVICFEDLNAGVRLPCSHIFHANCIHDWLVVGNSCPLCRFQLPSVNTSE
ncbi:hypothetical protein TSUD_18530 [Trifolium subterraneum]|uniref:RING-type E3 ubiquitin transferase n=1 Tax=Trifolium subterraneum TaxID=3900 RepID=A0A2Z6ML02_TRISU|nr:hypothetical protein TSUD_18530 [Trifolium subterraneum]